MIDPRRGGVILGSMTDASALFDDTDACPCGSGQPYGVCCGPLHRGLEQAPTAERLMRSRYSAYFLGLADYVLTTWASSTRPAELTLATGPTWRRLQIVDTADGGPADSAGMVEFRASYRDADGVGLLHERSRFAREDNRWVYLEGEILD